LGRTVKSPRIRKATPASKVKVAHLLRIGHRDEVEAPVTDWLHEAYRLQDVIARPQSTKATTRRRSKTLTGTSTRDKRAAVERRKAKPRRSR
jgi:hypothetical protein